MDTSTTTSPLTQTAPASPSSTPLAPPSASTSTTPANSDTPESLQKHLKTLLVHLDDLRASRGQKASQLQALFRAGAKPTTKRSIVKFSKLFREIRRFKWWIRETKRELHRVSERFEELQKSDEAGARGFSPKISS